MVGRRAYEWVIEDILGACRGEGAVKRKVKDEAHFRDYQITNSYLSYLIRLKFIENVGGRLPYYKTTDRGENLYELLQRTHEKLRE